MKKFLLSCAFALCCVVLMSGVSSAADEKKAPAGEGKMSAEEAKMMEKWMAYMTPGKEHEMLAKEVGTWKTENKMWMSKDAPARTSMGTCTCEMVLGGRYLWTTDKSEMMGQPFEGHAMVGYDNNKKKYMMTWADNMGTGIMMMEGTASMDGKTITYNGKMDDCMTGEKDKPLRIVITWTDESHKKFEMYDNAGRPGELKIMESVYSR